MLPDRLRATLETVTVIGTMAAPRTYFCLITVSGASSPTAQEKLFVRVRFEKHGDLMVACLPSYDARRDRRDGSYMYTYMFATSHAPPMSAAPRFMQCSQLSSVEAVMYIQRHMPRRDRSDYTCMYDIRAGPASHILFAYASASSI